MWDRGNSDLDEFDPDNEDDQEDGASGDSGESASQHEESENVAEEEAGSRSNASDMDIDGELDGDDIDGPDNRRSPRPELSSVPIVHRKRGARRRNRFEYDSSDDAEGSRILQRPLNRGRSSESIIRSSTNQVCSN